MKYARALLETFTRLHESHVPFCERFSELDLIHWTGSDSKYWMFLE